MGQEKKNLLYALSRKRLWINILLGFSGGLPIMLIYQVIKIWLRREGVEISTIGLMSWIALPYSFNFLMAPILDRFTPHQMGRRRSWLLLTQLGLIFSLIGLGLTRPEISVTLCALMGLCVAIFGAIQDVIIDAYKREILPDDEIGLGSSIYVYGYRVAMLVTSGFGLWVVDPSTLGLSFNQLFFILAGLMLVGVATTFIANEPEGIRKPVSMKEAVVDPFMEFFKRDGIFNGFVILSFIFLFKFGDSMSGTMLGPFYVDMGYSNKIIAEVTKGIGFFSTMAGLGVGAYLLYRLNIVLVLLSFGILQALSTACFAVLTTTAYSGSWWALAFVVGFEDFSGGLGTTALITFMATMTNRNYTATQYALFASLAALGKTLFGGFSGILVESLGYAQFFVACAFMAIPGLALIYFVNRLRSTGDLESQTQLAEVT